MAFGLHGALGITAVLTVEEDLNVDSIPAQTRLPVDMDYRALVFQDCHRT